jgi:hypothetical protein
MATTEGDSMSVLGQSFKSVQRAAKDRAKHAALRVWPDLDKPSLWHASFSAASGGVGGIGPTPEQAIESAARNFVNLAIRNA